MLMFVQTGPEERALEPNQSGPSDETPNPSLMASSGTLEEAQTSTDMLGRSQPLEYTLAVR
jgi:hypothetical protein